ncbi:RDD family protein [Chlorogloeopsis sp. ULAP02]|uniref:RDD family protein n=1 Tax=Chlorogloeopsis sp. ULAP02 TaxID=3107926 RepID=UPI0031365B3D
MHIFNRIKYQTPESVELEFVLAGIGSRAWALLIDYHVLALIFITFISAWLFISVQLIDWLTNIFSSEKVGIWLYAIALLVNYFIYTGYFVFFETIWQGQTPGKRIAKIRVLKDNGSPIGLQQAALRALLRPIDDTLFLGTFFIIFGRREKRVGDWIAGTIVIQAQPPSISTTFTISEQAKSICQELLETANLSAMLPDDFAVIREYLLRRKGMSQKGRESVALQLAKQVKSIINLEKLPEAINPDIFLEAIYLAYQQSSNFGQ